MIRKLEALHYRCLRYTSVPLKNFEILVGPNASGKTTFLDVVGFLGDLVSEGPETAIRNRTQNFMDLVWGRQGDRFELAIELEIPSPLQQQLSRGQYPLVRYEVAVGLEQATQALSILSEKVLLKQPGKNPAVSQRSLFPEEWPAPKTIISSPHAKNAQTVVNKVSKGNDNFYSEVYPAKGKGWTPSFRLGPHKSALGNLPADTSKFPVASWLKGVLTDGVQHMMLNSLLVRKASPPGLGRTVRPDGSNLPWVIEDLKRTDPGRFDEWLGHVQTALPDITGIRTIERPDDRHRYLVLQYSGGLEVPSWMVSDGSLRLLALTLLAYLPAFSGIYLIEEPENGIHPRAVETVFQSLSSAYEAQILLATHSPVILSVADSADVLCFSKTAKGVVDIVQGNEHPALKDWKGETNLGALFASGVLG